MRLQTADRVCVTLRWVAYITLVVNVHQSISGATAWVASISTALLLTLARWNTVWVFKQHVFDPGSIPTLLPLLGLLRSSRPLHFIDTRHQHYPISAYLPWFAMALIYGPLLSVLDLVYNLPRIARSIRNHPTPLSGSTPRFLDRFWSLLSFALPKRVRENSWQPTVNELLADYFEARVLHTSNLARAWVLACILGRTGLAWLCCIRIAIAGGLLPKRVRDWLASN